MKQKLSFVIFILALSLTSCFALGHEPALIKFPQDEGGHGGLKNLEWWYTALRIKGKTTGHEYAIMVSHFNNNFRFFSIANLSEGTFHSDTTWGILKSQKGALHLTHKTRGKVDILKGLDFHQKFYALESYGKDQNKNEMSVQAALENLKPPLLVGLNGYVPVGNSGHSYYYSLSRMKAHGTIKFQGVQEEFQGEAWLDHQWGPFFVSPISFGNLLETYEWFCIQLDNGSEIMISQIFNTEGVVPWDQKHAFVHIHDQNGNTKMYQDSDFSFERLAFIPHQSRPGRQVSALWRLKVQEENLDLLITPYGRHNHYINFPFNGDFIEGATFIEGSHQGEDVKGQGFAELIKTF